MRHIPAAIAATSVAIGLVLAGCSNDDSSNSSEAASKSVSAALSSGGAAASSALSGIESALSGVQNQGGDLVDQARAAGFIALMKSGYPELSEGRSDADLKQILDDTCKDIKDGKSDADGKEALAERVKNNGAALEPGEDAGLYEAVKAVC